MSESEMITVIFVTNIVYMIISSWHIARIGYEMHKIFEQLKEKNENNNIQSATVNE